MVKAKQKAAKAGARAERAAARASSLGTASSSTAVTTHENMAAEATLGAEDTSFTSTRETESPAPEAPAQSAPGTSEEPPAVETPPSRADLLRSKQHLVGRFMRLIVPILVDVYAATVALQTRTKSLTGILKAVSFLESGDLLSVLKVRAFAPHLSVKHSC